MASKRAEEARQELEELKKPVMCFSGKLELTDQELGRGAFGVIYKGVDPKTGMILVCLGCLPLPCLVCNAAPPPGAKGLPVHDVIPPDL